MLSFWEGERVEVQLFSCWACLSGRRQFYCICKLAQASKRSVVGGVRGLLETRIICSSGISNWAALLSNRQQYDIIFGNLFKLGGAFIGHAGGGLSYRYMCESHCDAPRRGKGRRGGGGQKPLECLQRLLAKDRLWSLFFQSMPVQELASRFKYLLVPAIALFSDPLI